MYLTAAFYSPSLNISNSMDYYFAIMWIEECIQGWPKGLAVDASPFQVDGSQLAMLATT